MKNDIAKKKLCLCIDTSTKVASVALASSLDDNDINIIYSAFINDGLTHSEKLIPLINQSLEACDLKVSDIDVFACINGPGSFTGLRIGISTANALAQSTGKDIIGITSLETLAFTFNYFDGLIIPMIDARRDNVFTAVFDGKTDFINVLQDDIMTIDEVIDSLKDTDRSLVFAGCGSLKAKDRVKMIFGDRAKFANGLFNNVNAAIGAELALKKYYSDDYVECKVLLPNYVKGTSAKTIAERDIQAKK